MQPPSPASRWLSTGLALFALFVCVGIVLYPLVPASRVTASDPVNGEPMLIQRTHFGQAFPFILTWAAEGYRRHPAARWLPLILLAASFLPVHLPGKSRLKRRDVSLTPGPFWLTLGVAAVALATLRLLQVRPDLNRLFGDGPTLPGEVQRGLVFAAEPATMHLFQLARRLLEMVSGGSGGGSAIRLVDTVAGVGFVLALRSLAGAVGRSLAERAALFAGLVSSGAGIMFCGYIETTQVELFAVAWYAAAAAAVAKDPAQPALSAARISAAAAAGLAVTAHGAGVLLLPSLPLVLTAPGPAGARIRQLFTWQRILLVSATVIVPFVLIVLAPFYARGDFGNVTGGGDGIALVPWSVDYARLPSRFVYYSMFSAWHFLDIANALWIAAPTALLLLALVALRRSQVRPALRPLLAWFGVMTMACVMVPLAWNHDYGMWGDWNLAACYLFPLHVLAWVGFAATWPKEDGRSLWRAVALVVCIQIGAALGLYLQFR